MTLLTDLRQLVQSDLDAVDGHIKQHLSQNLRLIENLSQHLIDSGGKRLRPLLVLLSAKAWGYTGSQHIPLAVAVEYFHAATLLHDDVIDESLLRHNQLTANHIWGDKATILVGDYLFTQTFQLLVDCGQLDILSVIASAATAITQGEVLQLVNCHNSTITKAAYFDIIHRKTAMLFSAAAQIGALLTNQPAEYVNAMNIYGLQLGKAFQLIDDALDYTANPEELGKNIGDDLAEGKATLPLIHILEHGSTAQQQLVTDALKTRKSTDFESIMTAIDDTRAIDVTKQLAREAIDEALSALEQIPKSPYQAGLAKLAEFSITRTR